MTRRAAVMLCVLALLFPLACTPPPAPAAEEAGDARQFADVVYTVPDGWRRVSVADGRLHLATDDRERFPIRCDLYLYPGVPKADFDGDAEAFLRQRMAADLEALVAEDDDTEVFGPEEKGELTVGETHGLAIARGVENGRRRMELYFVLDRPTRYVIARFVAPARDQAAAAAVATLVEESVTPLLGSLRFVGEDARPLLGPPTPGRLDGVWWGNALQNRYGLSGMQLTTVTAAYVFRADGRFHRGIPQEGPAADLERLVRECAAPVGNYRIVGDEIQLAFADGETRTLRFDPASRVISAGSVRMNPARVPPDGFTFDGRRTRTHYTSFSTGLASTGGVGGSHTWVYHKDGTVTADHFTSVTGGFDRGGGFAGSSKQEDVPGRYRVANGQLETTEPGEDGQPVTKRTTILLFDRGDEAPPDILVGGDFIKPLKEDESDE